MKTAKIGDIFEWNGQLVKVEWINEGHKAIGFKVVAKVFCPHCQKEVEYIRHEEPIESSIMFQENAKPIQTISEI